MFLIIAPQRWQVTYAPVFGPVGTIDLGLSSMLFSAPTILCDLCGQESVYDFLKSVCELFLNFLNCSGL